MFLDREPQTGAHPDIVAIGGLSEKQRVKSLQRSVGAFYRFLDGEKPVMTPVEVGRLNFAVEQKLGEKRDLCYSSTVPPRLTGKLARSAGETLSYLATTKSPHIEGFDIDGLQNRVAKKIAELEPPKKGGALVSQAPVEPQNKLTTTQPENRVIPVKTEEEGEIGMVVLAPAFLGGGITTIFYIDNLIQGGQTSINMAGYSALISLGLLGIGLYTRIADERAAENERLKRLQEKIERGREKRRIHGPYC